MTAGAAMLAAGGWFERFAQNPFYHHALLGGLGVALLCGVLSVFVVLKRMAFIGEGISHAAFGGYAAAAVAQLCLPAAGAAPGRDLIVAGFCLATAMGIGWLARRGRLSEDTAIGVGLVTAMALGVLLLDFRSARSVGYIASLHDILFGDILFISATEVWTVWALALAVAAAVVVTFRHLVFFCFDEESARAFGVPTAGLYYGLLAALALAVVAAMKGVGVILAGALLVVPGASARLWSDRIGRVAALSVVLALAGVGGGFFLSLGLSQYGDYSSGPIIVLGLVAILGLSYAVRAIRRAVRRRREPRPGVDPS